MKPKLVKWEDAILHNLGGGTARKVLATQEQLMIVEVHFETGAVGSLHTHPHAQNTYVLSGRFRFTAGEKEIEVSQGDSLAFPPNIPHGTLCLEKGVLLDIFNPMRKDFLVENIK